MTALVFAKPLRVLDLFSGLGGWGAAFRDRGHDVTSIDYEPRFGSSLVLSVMDIKALNGWDVILASPPCECFSVMTIGRNWTREHTPKTDKARHGTSSGRFRSGCPSVTPEQPRHGTQPVDDTSGW